MIVAAVNETVIITEIRNERNYSVYECCKLIERTKNWPVGTNQQRLPTGLSIPGCCQPNTHILEQIQREHITQTGRVLPITTTLEYAVHDRVWKVREVTDNKKAAHMATSAGRGRAWSYSGDPLIHQVEGAKGRWCWTPKKKKKRRKNSKWWSGRPA